MSKITLIGLYNFLKDSGDDLFLNLSLPTGIDKEAVVNNILMKGGEFEVLYPEPYFIKSTMVTWSKKWHWTFDKWLKAINIEYNPLENYDRIEESTDHKTDSGHNNSNRTDTRTDDLSQTTNGSNTGNTENKVSAFDASTYQAHDKTDSTLSNNETVSNTGTQTQTGVLSATNNLTSDMTHSSRMHGNIGVTTSQQMLQSELDIAMFNLYDKITDIFLQEYIIPIY